MTALYNASQHLSPSLSLRYSVYILTSTVSVVSRKKKKVKKKVLYLFLPHWQSRPARRNRHDFHRFFFFLLLHLCEGIFGCYFLLREVCCVFFFFFSLASLRYRSRTFSIYIYSYQRVFAFVSLLCNVRHCSLSWQPFFFFLAQILPFFFFFCVCCCCCCLLFSFHRFFFFLFGVVVVLLLRKFLLRSASLLMPVSS